MSLLTISPYNRTQSFYIAEEEIKFEEGSTFEPEWDPETISQDEANKYAADLETQIEARVVAQKGPQSPAEDRIHWRMLERALQAESRLKDIERTKRTQELLLEFLDPKNDSI